MYNHLIRGMIFMNSFLQMFYESIFGLVALFIFTKVLGKTHISQLTPFDFVAAVVLGELVGNALFDEKAGIIDIGYVIILWGTLLYSIEMIAQKFKGSRFYLEGKPSIIIQKGNIIYEEMRKNNLDLNELQQLLRMKDVFSVQEVEYAILETNGQLSVLKKAPYQNPTNEDLNIQVENPILATTIIADGEIIKDNLAEANLSEEWLLEELKRQNFNNVKEVFYAEWLDGKQLFAYPYTKIKHKDYKKKL